MKLHTRKSQRWFSIESQQYTSVTKQDHESKKLNGVKKNVFI